MNGTNSARFQAVLVELVWRHVGGCHHHDAALEQLLEKPPEDHGVGNVGDVKLVEAQEPGFFGQRVGDEPDRILALVIAALHALPHAVNALVNVEHELVKMSAALTLDRARLEEEIHQHGLAAADLAIDVQALDLRQRALPAGEQPAKRRGFARQTIFRDPRFKARHHVEHRELSVVALDAARSDTRGIMRCDGIRHEGFQRD